MYLGNKVAYVRIRTVNVRCQKRLRYQLCRSSDNSELQWPAASVTRKKLLNVHKSSPKIISLEI